MYQQRSVATVIILSIVTCGIYMFYWLYVVNDFLRCHHPAMFHCR